MDKGIVLIANGHPMYGFYAHNLLIGLKHHAPNLPVALITDGAALCNLEKEDIKRFDTIIDTKPEWITSQTGGKDYLKCKLHVGEATPFKKTLYLDVDMQWCRSKSPEMVFDDLKGISFTVANRGIATGDRRTEFMDVKEGEKYGVSEMYDISSEWMYFEDPRVLNTAAKIYNENKIQVDPFDLSTPDEPYIALAMAVCGVTPHKTPYHPTYWQPHYHGKFHGLDFIYENHYAFSIGGRANPAPIRQKYNVITGSYFHDAGIGNRYYQAQDKITVFKKEGRRQKR